MDGQGRVLGGVTVGEPELIKKYIYLTYRTFLITFNAWVLSKV
jgi:O-succinylhomoserine sulfhydrylase